MKAITFLPNATVSERVAALKKQCVTKREENFQRTLTGTDVEKERFDYSENGGKLKGLEAEAKASADEFKEKINVVKKEMDLQLARIQTGKREVFDQIYGIPNPESGNMEFFDKYGEMISSRKLTPDEYNGRMFDNEGEADANIAAAPREIGYEQPDKYADVQDADFEEVTENVADEAGGEVESEQETPKPPRKPRKSKKSDKDTESEK